jgi:hypothetical protein
VGASGTPWALLHCQREDKNIYRYSDKQ